MKKIKTLSFAAFIFLLIGGFTWLFAQQEVLNEGPAFPESCTSIMVGKLASTDGSVMTAHSCDGNYRTWLDIIPAKKFTKDTVRPVYWGTLHTEEPWDMRNVTKKGDIPEVRETFAYMSVAYPCMNEKQLAIGETTITGRRELVNKDGLFLVEELEKIALERCSTARQAIQMMGALAEQYGYGDWAECLTVADPKEVWQFEIAGSGAGKPSAMWVAQRIPDDHVGVSANIPRISDVDFNNPDFFMYSKDLKERAKKLGYWDGKAPFKFWKVIGTGKPFAIRDYYILSTMAPSLNLQFDAEELPFSVKPDKKVSVRDVMSYYRETYEGTEWDMTKNLMVQTVRRNAAGKMDTIMERSPIAYNWLGNDLRNLLNTLKPGAVERQRTIAVPQCSYSQVIQCRSWMPDEIGAVAWFSFDNPGQSPRIPIFSGVTKLPESFKICGQNRYRPEAAVWAFRETNKISTLNWAKGRKLIEPAVAELEDKAFDELPALETKVVDLVKKGERAKAKEIVTAYTNDFAAMAIRRWQDLKSELWPMFGRGY